jgi:hypothetical protein
MNFCPKCGRQRTGNVRFCGGCGNDFGEPAADNGTPLAAEPVAEVPLTAAVPVAAEATRLEPIPVPPASAAPDQLASWFAEPSAADEVGSSHGEPADRWNTADTIYAKPTQAPGYRPPSQPASAFTPPPAHAAPRRRSGGGRRAAFIIVVTLVALAAGGGAYAFASRSHDQAAAQPPSHPTVTAHASTAPAVPPSNSPAASGGASPSTSPSASATPSPTQTGAVRVAAGVASNPAAPQVEAFLNRYFNSINTRNYSEYNSLLDAQKQQADSQSIFDSGYATTKDTNEVLVGITDTGGGSLTANVSFTSHQSAADSRDESACTDWQISLFLVPQGVSYVETTGPASYAAADTDC